MASKLDKTGYVAEGMRTITVPRARSEDLMVVEAGLAATFDRSRLESPTAIANKAHGVIRSFLGANYHRGCGSECPGEAAEASELLRLLRPILHRERDFELARKAAGSTPH